MVKKQQKIVVKTAQNRPDRSGMVGRDARGCVSECPTIIADSRPFHNDERQTILS